MENFGRVLEDWSIEDEEGSYVTTQPIKFVVESSIHYFSTILCFESSIIDSTILRIINHQSSNH